MNNRKIINFTNTYSCPFCLQGELKNIILMDAFSCDFCQHIFTVNIEKQVLTIEGSQFGIQWWWNGKSWRRLREKEREIGWGYWVGIASTFISLPTIIVGSAAYLFPPLDHSKLSWFPLFWTILTFISHLICLVWFILEYYQFPLGLYLRGRAQRWFR